MTRVNTLVAKELRSYFVSPVVYVVGAVFLLIVGLLAYIYIVFTGAQAIQLMQVQGQAQINLNDLVFRNLFSSIRFVLLIVLPILTMRLFAEEKKLRTFELLMTSPIGLNEIVAGKFMSVFVLFLGLLGLTGLIPLTLALFSDFDWYPILTGYVGLALLGALFLSVGVLASALTENQIVAAFVSFGLLLFLWLLAGVGSLLGDTPAGQVISYLSFMEHYDHLVPVSSTHGIWSISPALSFSCCFSLTASWIRRGGNDLEGNSLRRHWPIAGARRHDRIPLLAGTPRDCNGNRGSGAHQPDSLFYCPCRHRQSGVGPAFDADGRQQPVHGALVHWHPLHREFSCGTALASVGPV